MKKKSFKFIFTTLLSGLLLFSCKNDDGDKSPEKPDLGNQNPLPKDETWVIFNGIEKWAGGIYALGDNKAREIDLSKVPFFQLEYSAGGRLSDNILYKKDGSMKSELGISKYKLESGKFVSDGFLSAPNNTYETNYLVVNFNEGYYWNLVEGGLKVQKFNPSTMQRTGVIDFSSLSKGNQYEAAGQLILAKRDDKLYVDIQHGTRSSDWQVKPSEEKVEVAVYNLSTNKIEMVTEYKGATNLGVFADHVLWSLDEVTKDLYMIAIGDMKTQKPVSRILRIKNGESNFDQNFELKISDYQTPSDFNRILAYNNKIYTTVSSKPASYYGGGHGVSYRDDIWYWTEIDTNTKKARRLDKMLPDNFYSYQNPFYNKGKIYFITNNTTQNFAGVYEFNPASGEVKETFHLKGSGKLMGFNIINN